MKNIFLLIIFLTSVALSAQVTNEATPRGWSVLEKSDVAPIVLRAPDVKQLKSEDLASQNDLRKSLRVGSEINVSMNLFNSGTWKNLSNGDRIWMLNVKAENAKFLRAIFDLYSLPEGAELYLYNNQRTDKIGPYTSSENQEDGVLGSWMISGDHLWLEYYEPAAVKGQGRLSLSSITYGYVDVNADKDSIAKINESGACNVDVLCDPNVGNTGQKDWSNARDNYKNSVARILISTSQGSFLCTGSMINNAAQDTTPFFLTANHCLGSVNDGAGSSFNASGWSFGFQWFTTTPDCATFAGTQGPQNPTRVLSGAQLRANNDDSDFALFLINQTPPADWNIYYAGWNRSTVPSTAQFGIHHPSGDIMKIARNDQTCTSAITSFNGNPAAQMWRIENWDYGVTEGGSSGSFILDQNERIVGQLAGGAAACSGTSDNGQFDIYGKFDISWNSGFNASQRLRDWLDPSNSGVVTLDGAYYTTLGTEDVPAIELNIKIYPNPSGGVYTLESDLSASYQVFNLNGQMILSGATGISGNQLNISDAAAGLYFVKISVGEQTITRKLVKQ
ncbi:T9SS type A sorting domain-containing protein [Nonlabens marinus]|uniref:Lysyl endopeptidase n=1 Tax=Nonlabens marinus S1-08 TaxID=1454201 RepID=W8VU82_9FLAO|nr:T9SS type A sorting domain-containing protein [Nonlabens marinus]BAO54373.1 lysyl endopeptidase [Nonlabens marinus S1-08]